MIEVWEPNWVRVPKPPVDFDAMLNEVLRVVTEKLETEFAKPSPLLAWLEEH